ncbi:MAG: hypothetical protein ACXVPM_20035 [Bacteroidia bacterium]
MNKIILTLLFLSFAFVSLGQDLITKKDSSKILCKIIKEDETTLYYINARDKDRKEMTIKKSDVLKYLSSNPVPKSGGLRIDTASKIYNAKILTKGFYNSFTEYISNSPSTTSDLTTVERTKADLLLNHGSDYSYKTNGEAETFATHWGFCDGNNTYVHYDHPRGYCRVELIGPFSFFTYVVHGTGAFSLIPDQLMVIDQNGKFHDGTVKYIKKILEEHYPELATKYKAEEKAREKRKEYLTLLNEYLINKK